MRVLVADDDAGVLAGYRAAFSELAGSSGADGLAAMAAELFDDAPGGRDCSSYDLDLTVEYVEQGLDAVEVIRDSVAANDPIRIVFLDMRMPPGIDGKETARLIRQIDPDVHIVMVTGYTDSKPTEVAKVAPPLNKLFYVVKPFEADEILQLTRALGEKWQTERDLANVNRELVAHVEKLEAINIELAASEAKVRHAAFHDSLTGMPNRAAFMRELATRVKQGSFDHCAVMIDLDRFKSVNDNLGHAGGDELIRLTAKALAKTLPEEAFLARLGGDEFGIILPTSNRDLAFDHCERMVVASKAEHNIFGHSISGGASVGFALADQDVDRDPIDILRRADLALYAAKRAGRGIVWQFDKSLDEGARFRLSIEQGLREAIAQDRLGLAFQPIVKLDALDIVGFEALVRWTSAEHGEVSPSLFVPIAEESSLIHELSDWVVPRALTAAKDWPGQFVSINFSPRQFHRPNLVDSLIAQAEQAGIERHRIQVEITETALFDNTELATSIVENLQQAGFKVALDDFGTGYSSLFNLKNFNIDCIKIDRSFVDSLGTEATSTAIVTSISQLARTMGLSVVAEGVENEYQHRALEISGCSHMQGYRFGVPVSAGEACESVNSADGSPVRRTAA